MIIDTHAYCFEAWDSARGYPGGAAEHLQLVLEGNAGHHQPAMRIPDGALGDSAAMLRPDANFRLDKRGGRIMWDDGGASYSKYFSPPNLLGCEYTPYSLDSEMHYA